MEHSKVPRSFFYQLYTIFGVVDEQKIPVVYALLKNKTTGIYRRLLQILKQKLRHRNKELAATAIVCDYELGFRNAIETDFPQIRIWGCYFHFSKALLKKIKEYGLFENTWFNLIPPNIFNVYSRPQRLRTINSCEGYNNRFNIRVGKRIKPNFWIFLQTLQKEEKIAKIKYEQYKLGYSGPIQTRKWRLLNERIQNLKNRFEAQQINIDDFWTNISHLCQNLS